MPADHDLSVVPTLDWQDKLALRLGSAHPHPDAYGSPVSPGASLDTYGVPHSQRRRLDEGTLDIMAQQAQSPMSTQESSKYPLCYPFPFLRDLLSASSYEPTDAMGQLSLDEDQEVCSGLLVPSLVFTPSANSFDITAKPVVSTF